MAAKQQTQDEPGARDAAERPAGTSPDARGWYPTTCEYRAVGRPGEAAGWLPNKSPPGTPPGAAPPPHGQARLVAHGELFLYAGRPGSWMEAVDAVGERRKAEAEDHQRRRRELLVPDVKEVQRRAEALLAARDAEIADLRSKLEARLAALEGRDGKAA